MKRDHDVQILFLNLSRILLNTASLQMQQWRIKAVCSEKTASKLMNRERVIASGSRILEFIAF